MTCPTASTPIRTIWFGMRCDFTQAALMGAAQARKQVIQPVALVLPRGPKAAAAGWPEPPFDRWVREQGIELIEVDGLSDASGELVLDAIDQRDIALGVGACFPWKVSKTIRASIPTGVVNIHPSLLPSLRGSEPVFHMYRLGHEVGGVTIHQMDSGWDSGPIIRQERVRVPEHGRADAFEAELARRGGELLSRIGPDWCAGAMVPISQDALAATWAPEPTETDRIVSSRLTVKQATRFVEACGPLWVRDAENDRVVEVDGAATENNTEGVRVRCCDGFARFARTGTATLTGVTGTD